MTKGTLILLKKYELPIIKVVSENEDTEKKNELKEAYTGHGKMINSEFLNGLNVSEA